MKHTVAKALVGKAFRDIRALNMLAGQDFMCCSSCGGAEMEHLANTRSQGRPAGVVFYHHQDATRFAKSGYLCIRFEDLYDETKGRAGTKAVGHIVFDILRRHGLPVEWDGDPDRCIELRLSEEGDM